MAHELLGTDGFRGVFEDTDRPGGMNPSTVAELTCALTSMQLEAGETGPFVVGMDTRYFNPRLEQAAVSGAKSAGIKEREILRLGIAPTPAILRTAQQHGAIAAVALTASHNPAKYAGWKGTTGSDKPSPEQAREIEDRYWSRVKSGLVVPLMHDYRRSAEHLEAYIKDVVESIEEIFGERPLANKLFAVDTAYGAANIATPAVLEALGAKVERFANDTSHPINEGAGATNLDGVRQFLRERPELVENKQFVGALVNDGDADRFLGVGARIRNNREMEFATLDGNRVLELLAENEVGVVGTDYTNDASIKRITESGTEFEFCRNGDTNLTLALRAHGAPWHIGSEFTGHHVALDWLSSGDGVRTAAFVAALAAKRNATLMELCDDLPLFPEKMRTLEIASTIGKTILELPAINELLALTDEDKIQGFRNHCRQSGTELDTFRIWGVGQDETYVDRRTAQIEAAILLTAAGLEKAA